MAARAGTGDAGSGAELDRTRVLAHRVVVQGLADPTPADELATLDALRVGLQDTPAGSGRLALRARTTGALPSELDGTVHALTVRGAPHVHQRADLARLRRLLLPRDEAEVVAWLGGQAETVLAADEDAVVLMEDTATAMRRLFPGETATKGELSGLVTPELPPVARPWCDRCGVEHVLEGLFRLATLAAGIELVPDAGRRLVFQLGPEPSASRPPVDRSELGRRFLHHAGPVRRDDLTSWLATLPAPLGATLADRLLEQLEPELTRVQVDGEQAWLLADDLDAVRSAERQRVVRLLPPHDAFLRGWRELVVPDRAAAKQVWRATSAPGALLVDGDVAGTWRHRRSGRRVEVDVAPFARVQRRRLAQLEEEAEGVAVARGVDGGARLRVADPARP